MPITIVVWVILRFSILTKGTKTLSLVELVWEITEFSPHSLCEPLLYQHDPTYQIFLFIIKEPLKLLIFLFTPP